MKVGSEAERKATSYLTSEYTKIRDDAEAGAACERKGSNRDC